MEQNLAPTEDKKMDTTLEVYKGASTLVIDEPTQTKLLASFDKNEIEIRPDGLIYLPQTFWRKRLNESFGIGQWCLVVKNSFKDPSPEKDKLYVEGILMVRGCYMATAVGEAELHTDNPLQSWASVFESAKSDCITRCCKDLSIASELWQPEFNRNWIKENAVKVWIEKKDGKKGVSWRKKTSEKLWNETGIVAENNAPQTTQAEPKNGTTEKNKPTKWLNKYTSKKEDETTKEWKNTVEKLMDGVITMQNIEGAYLLSKQIRSELEVIAKTVKPKGEKLENVTEEVLTEERREELEGELPF